MVLLLVGRSRCSEPFGSRRHLAGIGPPPERYQPGIGHVDAVPREVDSRRHGHRRARPARGGRPDQRAQPEGPGGPVGAGGGPRRPRERRRAGRRAVGRRPAGLVGQGRPGLRRPPAQAARPRGDRFRLIGLSPHVDRRRDRPPAVRAAARPSPGRAGRRRPGAGGVPRARGAGPVARQGPGRPRGVGARPVGGRAPRGSPHGRRGAHWWRPSSAPDTRRRCWSRHGHWSPRRRSGSAAGCCSRPRCTRPVGRPTPSER